MVGMIAGGIYPVMSYLVSTIYLSWYLLYFVMVIQVFLMAQTTSPKISVLNGSLVLVIWTLPYTFFEGQRHYVERLIMESKTRHGQFETTRWKNDFWHYYNQELQFSTLDGHMYGEAAVHPAMIMSPSAKKILVVGGENGLIAKELIKYINLDWKILPLDPEYARYMHRDLSKNFHFPDSFTNPFRYLKNNERSYDLIFIDTPIANNYHSNLYFTREFFTLCSAALKEDGIIVVSSSDQLIRKSDSEIIRKTLNSLDLSTRTYAAQIPTLGQWSWTLASKKMRDIVPEEPKVSTRWLNKEAIKMMITTTASKEPFRQDTLINSIKFPILVDQYNMEENEK
jgi:spermidine synthase